MLWVINKLKGYVCGQESVLAVILNIQDGVQDGRQNPRYHYFHHFYPI